MAKNARSDNSWERQPGETTQAFEAFELYCKMGSERSIRKVAQKMAKTDSLLRRWSSRWSWVNRARDYDNEIRRKEVIAEKKQFREMKQRHISMAIQLQKKAFEALRNLPPEELTPKDIREFMKLGTELERANLNIAEQEEIRDTNEEMTIDIYLPEKDGDNGE